jgi:hypothetical protein
MNTNIRLLLFLFESILVTSSDIPSKTGIRPVMEFFDSEYVLVNYSASFDIPDFSIINGVSVYKDKKLYGKASREYTDGDNDNNEDKCFQPLLDNTKIKAKLDPCLEHKFYIRMTFLNGHLDSKNVYKPNNFLQVSRYRRIVLFLIFYLYSAYQILHLPEQ